MKEMVIKEIGINWVSMGPVPKGYFVLLKEKTGDRYVPIFIGQRETDAIVEGLVNIPGLKRPMTWDLLGNTIKEMGGSIVHITVNELRESTFYAKVAIAKNGETQEVDSRPSDAIALAVREGCPIMAEDAVIEKIGLNEEKIRTFGPSYTSKLWPFVNA